MRRECRFQAGSALRVPVRFLPIAKLEGLFATRVIELSSNDPIRPSLASVVPIVMFGDVVLITAPYV
jgi:hypothetical protein